MGKVRRRTEFISLRSSSIATENWNKIVIRRVFPGLRGRNQPGLPRFPPELDVYVEMGTWIGVTPQWRRIPAQLVLLVVIGLALAGLSRLRMPRWSLAVVTGILALGCLALRIGAGLPGTSDCLSGEHVSFCHAHEHLGDQHDVVVAKHASRQNRHS